MEIKLAKTFLICGSEGEKRPNRTEAIDELKRVLNITDDDIVDVTPYMGKYFLISITEDLPRSEKRKA